MQSRYCANEFSLHFSVERMLASINLSRHEAQYRYKPKLCIDGVMRFTILGAHKSGTSTAVAIANSHPKVLCLYEVDFSKPSNFARNAELVSLLPESRTLFGSAHRISSCLEAVQEMLRARGHSFDSIGTKVPGLRPDLFSMLEYPALYLVRDVRLWAAKNRVAVHIIGRGNAVPKLVSYVATFVMSFQFPSIQRARLEDMLLDADALSRSVARLLGIDHSELGKWWTKTDWTSQFPKNYSDWTEGHRSAFLPPVFSDTVAELTQHSFWAAILPIFEKYYSAIDASFAPAEIEADLEALNDIWNSYTMTLDEGYESFRSFKIKDLIMREDGRVDARAFEATVKERGASWREET